MYWILTFLKAIKLKCLFESVTMFQVPGNLNLTCDRKCLPRPGLTFLSSIIMLFDGILAAQLEGLPLPLPILDPITFFVNGIWGNTDNHKYLLVILERLTDFFKKSFNLNKCLLKIKRFGLLLFKPIWPNTSFFVEVFEYFKVLIVRFFCAFLKITFLGRNNNYNNYNIMAIISFTCFCISRYITHIKVNT